jgi:hypothetical protein
MFTIEVKDRSSHVAGMFQAYSAGTRNLRFGVVVGELLRVNQSCRVRKGLIFSILWVYDMYASASASLYDDAGSREALFDIPKNLTCAPSFSQASL